MYAPKLSHVLLHFLFVFFLAFPVLGATLTVTTLEDTNDYSCDSHCSLREAIKAAAAGDTVDFARELRGGTIRLQATLLIDKRLTIDGPNKRRITVQGNNTFRIFHVDIAGAGRVATLDGLIIKGGSQIDGDGGGVYMDHGHIGTLNVTNCIISDNSAQRGGGISTYYGRLYLIDSTVANNIATGNFGGAGIDADHTSVQIMNSTVSGNRSTSTTDGVGGVRLSQPQNWFITGTTIAFNSASGSSDTSAGGLAALGGSPGPISNVILAKNTGLNPDFRGVSSGAVSSIIGIADRSGFVNGVNGNIVGNAKIPVDPFLGLLADNGGGILTHSILENSPAKDSGNNNFSIDRNGDPLKIDQRGYERKINLIVDIGSYEYGSQPDSVPSTISGKVTYPNGRGIGIAVVSIRDSNGYTRTNLTNTFGYFSFSVPAGGTYTITCLKRHKTFTVKTLLAEEIDEIVNFRAEPPAK